MFCPRCGANQSDELKFCKACGANLHAVRQVVDTRETGEKFDWSKTWVAEMFRSGEENMRRQAEIERLQGLTPEVKRYNEIKGGVITACVGVGLIIFLAVFMEGIVRGGKVPQDTAEILSRLWVAGVIPIFVGIGLIINGAFVSKKQAAIATRERKLATEELTGAAERQALRAGNTAEIIPPGFSVTEDTTKHLNVSGRKIETPNV